MSSRFPHRPVCLARVVALGLLLVPGWSLAQFSPELEARLPEVIPDFEPVVDHSLTLDLACGEYTSGLGSADGQSLTYIGSRSGRDSWRFSVGRQQRFDETSLGLGAAYSREIGNRTTMTLGGSGGTGNLVPEYRVDASLSRPVLGVGVTLGVFHDQSKVENRSNGVSLGLARWFPHWILTGFVQQVYGHPGNTESPSYGFGLTYYQWRKLYVGVGYTKGSVSYLLVGAGQALADYDFTGYNVGVSVWFNDRSGVNVGADYTETDFYEVKSCKAGIFRSF